MKLFNVFLSVIASVALFTSCNKMSGLLAASSAANEVMVIMEKNAWEEPAGEAVFSMLNSSVIGLPQPEPNFRLIKLTPENFTRSFRTARNVVIPQISNIFSAPAINVKIDEYAIGQIIMYINAPDTTSFVQFVTDNRELIVNYIIDKELERNARWLMQSGRSGPLTRAQEKFGINIFPPRGLPNVNIDVPDFYWSSNNALRSRQDMVIYQFPYTTPDVFEKEALIEVRNRIMGDHIQGSFNSRMSTNTTTYPPYFRTLEVDGIFRAELRGLWEMDGDMMGGPFVMQAFVNENTARVIVVEMFVYAPETTKRNLIRNMEASFYTISMPGIIDLDM